MPRASARNQRISHGNRIADGTSNRTSRFQRDGTGHAFALGSGLEAGHGRLLAATRMTALSPPPRQPKRTTPGSFTSMVTLTSWSRGTAT